MTETYNGSLIIVFTLLFYAISLILVKTSKIKLINHRRFWNIILTISFFISAPLGIILVMQVDKGIFPALYPSFLWWHVESSLVMAIVALIHITWHFSYYKQIFLSIKNRKHE